MSAYTYINYADVPEGLLENALRGEADGRQMIQFEKFPFAGQIVGERIEFVWPIYRETRYALADILTYWGINFTVVM